MTDLGLFRISHFATFVFRIAYLFFYVSGFVENVSYYTGQNGKPNGDNSADKR